MRVSSTAIEAGCPGNAQAILNCTLLSPMMGSRIDEVIERSTTYRAICLLKRWTAGSTVSRLLATEYVLVSVLALFLLLSLVRVLTSTMGAPVKFLSFTLMFVLIVALTWNYTDPTADL